MLNNFDEWYSKHGTRNRDADLLAYQAGASSSGVGLSGVSDFLRQIVSVEPDNEALWISKVKANAYGYLGDLALINKSAGDDFPEPHMDTEPETVKTKYTITRTYLGNHAETIEEDGRTVLWLNPGTERGEENVERIVALLNLKQ